jgi:hypothetical protein
MEPFQGKEEPEFIFLLSKKNWDDVHIHIDTNSFLQADN